MNLLIRRLSLLVVAISILATSGFLPVSAEKTMKTVTDMDGRIVEIPVPLEHVITLGSVPVQNSFIFTIGEGDTIMNDLPESFKKQGRWKYQYIFAPQLSEGQSVQVSTNEPNVEQIIAMGPEVCFTMDKPTVELLESRGIPVIYLSWVDDDDVYGLMNLLGEVYDKEELASEYLDYFNDTIKRVDAVVSTIPENERKKVLSLSYDSMSVPHKISEWWITRAGGVSVTNMPTNTVSFETEPEQINQWNPDVIIVSKESDITGILDDVRLSDITAVKNNALYNAPFGAHKWANRGIELPLMVIWTAKTIYPEKFKDFDIEKETADFYEKFFGVRTNMEQTKEILSGNAKI